MTRPSIFEFLGGEPAFTALAQAFHDRCLQHPELAHPFEHSRPDHVPRLSGYLGEVFGGPSTFPDGHSGMLRIHAGEMEGHEKVLGDAFIECWIQAIQDVNVPAEARPALRAYMEYAIDEVNSYAPRNSTVPPELPVPRWSWDGHPLRRPMTDL